MEKNMEIWLDTIDEEAIADGVKTGVVSGVTTNPSLLSKARSVRNTLLRILDIQNGPVAVQVTASNPEEMVDEAVHLFEMSSRFIVKVPVNRSGLIAMKQLRRDNIPVMGTGVLFPAQALLACNAGVAYVAPYFSHMGSEEEACQALKTMIDLLKGTSTKILAASLKTVDQIVLCASLGVAAVTCKSDLYYKLLADHPVVEGFMQKFSAEWTAAHGNKRCAASSID
jgi:transaldolase